MGATTGSYASQGPTSGPYADRSPVTDQLTRSLVRPPGVVTSPVMIAAIQARMEWARTPWYRRLPWRRPAGWGTGRWGL